MLSKAQRRHAKRDAAKRARMSRVRLAMHDNRAFTQAATLNGRRGRRAFERVMRRAVGRVTSAIKGGTISRDDAELASILGIGEEND